MASPAPNANEINSVPNFLYGSCHIRLSGLWTHQGITSPFRQADAILQRREGDARGGGGGEWPTLSNLLFIQAHIELQCNRI